MFTECKCTASQIETPICPRRTAAHHFDCNNSIHEAHLADHWWNAEWLDKSNPARLRTFTPDTGNHPPGITLPRTAWVRPPHRGSCLQTGAGRFRSCLYKWGMDTSAACACGAEVQTVDHVVLQWPIHRPPHGLHGLTVLDDETIEWLLNTCPEVSEQGYGNRRCIPPDLEVKTQYYKSSVGSLPPQQQGS